MVCFIGDTVDGPRGREGTSKGGEWGRQGNEGGGLESMAIVGVGEGGGWVMGRAMAVVVMAARGGVGLRGCIGVGGELRVPSQHNEVEGLT